MKTKRIAACILSFTLILSLALCGVSAENAEGSQGKAISASSAAGYIDEYEKYCANYSYTGNSSAKISVSGGDGLISGDAEKISEFSEKNNCVSLKKGSTAEYTVSVNEASMYEIYLTYIVTEESGKDAELSLKLDGKVPFSATEDLVFPTHYVNLTEDIQKDKAGDDIIPEQTAAKIYATVPARDNAGVVTEPYKFYLDSGVHKISINVNASAMILAELTLKSVSNVKKYLELNDNGKSKLNTEPITVEAEDSYLKSNNSMSPRSDTGSAAVAPKSAKNDLINCIGGTTWQNPFDTLYWNITVEESGYYGLSFHFKQSDLINGDSIRKLKIDGEVPFAECEEIKFSYKPSWQYLDFADEKGNPYYIWLEKGDHTVSLEVTMGDMAQYYRRLSDIIDLLGQKYMEIVMITGDSPDVNRDYELFKQIPDLNDTLKSVYDDLMKLAADMEKVTGKRGNQYVAAIKNMARTVRNMYDSPYMAHQYVKNYYSNFCTLSSWLYDMKAMPLWLDSFTFAPCGDVAEEKNTGFFESVSYSFERFLSSFAADYSSDEGKSEKSLDLWVNWGIDQASALEHLIQDSFTKDTGIIVNVRVTNASLVKGILAGNFPDMSLHLARTEPVNLGIRGALYDLSQFDDYRDVMKRFQNGAEVPYCYNGKAYALPDTQNFYIMFYRTDIFEELGLTLPATWDEFIKAATVIQRNNMQIYVPYTQIADTTTVNTGLGGLNLYATLMAQNKVSVYNDKLDACNIDSNEAVSVFEFWTKLYTDYKYLKQADFYNRFRVGSMPLGIATYNTYLTLEDAAPEIKGKWAIACVPGVEGGTAAVAGSGTGCSIVKKSKNINEAWEFLKWWTSDDTQLRYSNNIESILGTVGRVQSANVNAVSRMAWDDDTKATLLEQWSRIEEVPEIPGSYYLTRAVDQAYWAVVNNGDNYQATMEKWAKIANGEISRKIKEYS